MTQTTSATRRRGGAGAPVAALVLGALAMGASPTFVRLADVGPFASAFWRVALALPALYAWMRIADAKLVAPRRFAPATLLSGLAFAGDLFFWHLSIVNTNVANATFFATCAPIWVVAFGWLLLGERASARTLAGLALCGSTRGSRHSATTSSSAAVMTVASKVTRAAELTRRAAFTVRK